MKYTFYIILISLLFSGCHSATEKNKSSDSVISAKSKPTVNPLAKKFEPFLKGVWVPSRYISDLERTKSPYNSSFAEVSCFYVSGLPSSDDSLHVGYSLGNHEGADFVLYLKQGQKPTSLKTSLTAWDKKGSFCNLGYRAKNNDTSLLIYYYDKQKRLYDSIAYTRVATKAADENDAAWGIQFIANKILFAGDYKVTEPLNATANVHFTVDGKVSGLSNFKDYYVNTDFADSAEDDIDEIVFDLHATNNTHYSYKIEADTISLLAIHYNSDSTKLVSGECVYKLVKQK